MISENDPERGPFIVETELELRILMAQAPAGLVARTQWPSSVYGKCLVGYWRRRLQFSTGRYPVTMRIELAETTIPPWCHFCNSFHY